MADHKPNETNDPTLHAASGHGDTHRTASERIDKGAERVKKATSSAVDSTHEAVDHAADRVEHGVHSGTDKAADAAKYAAEHGGEKWDGAVEYAGDFMDKARDYVREKPAQSLVMAVAAGWLVGRLMRRS
ncbi:MAG TPA: hypothetical protein VFJ15_01265 [Oleiagrimonas sp.]|nr:hypothetical protein [Oleiagrimonas sp.]